MVGAGETAAMMPPNPASVTVGVGVDVEDGPDNVSLELLAGTKPVSVSLSGGAQLGRLPAPN